MRKFAFLLLSTLALTACSSGTPAENAGKAMAETACLLFDDTVTYDQITEKTGEIMNDYGWEKPEDIDTYLSSVQGTPEADEVKKATADHLEATCGEAMAETGISPEELANSMVTPPEMEVEDTTSTEETTTEETTETPTEEVTQ